MTDYTLKYQVWTGGDNGKMATFPDVNHATYYLLGLKQRYPKAYIYNAQTEGYIGKDQWKDAC